MKKPPIGVYPERLWLEDRITALREAIGRYREVGRNCDDFEAELIQREVDLRVCEKGA